MRIIEDKDVQDVMDEVYSKEFELLEKVFGYDEACDAVEDNIDECEIEDVGSEIKFKIFDLIRHCLNSFNRDNKYLTQDEVATLGLDIDECIVEELFKWNEKDEDGNTIEYVYEDENQKGGGDMSQRLRCGFSHQYPKLFGQTCARLLDVKRMNRDDIGQFAIDYDTMYYDENCNPQYYVLEPGAYLRMTFIGNRGIPFTTYRKDNHENYAKYVNNIGKTFEIYVKKQEETK